MSVGGEFSIFESSGQLELGLEQGQCLTRHLSVVQTNFMEVSGRIDTLCYVTAITALRHKSPWNHKHQDFPYLWNHFV